MKKQIFLALVILSFCSSSIAGLAQFPKEKTVIKIVGIQKKIVNLEVFVKNMDSASNSKINKEVTDLKESLESLRQFMLNSPEAAVAITLIKKDIEYLKKENNLLRQETSNFSGMGQWFIGLLITIGIAAITISIPIKRKKKLRIYYGS